MSSATSFSAAERSFLEKLAKTPMPRLPEPKPAPGSEEDEDEEAKDQDGAQVSDKKKAETPDKKKAETPDTKKPDASDSGESEVADFGKIEVPDTEEDENRVSAADARMRKHILTQFQKENKELFQRLSAGRKNFSTRKSRNAMEGMLKRLRALLDKSQWEKAIALVPKAERLVDSTEEDERRRGEAEKRYQSLVAQYVKMTPKPDATRKKTIGRVLSKLEPAREVGDWPLFDKAASAMEALLKG